MNLIKAQRMKLTTKLSKRRGGFNPLETIVILLFGDVLKINLINRSENLNLVIYA